jgi:phosphoglycolate phosphatase
MSDLRLAVFDVDGTLVDSQHNIVAAMEAAWRRFGLPDPDPTAVRRVIGLPLVEAVATLIPDLKGEAHVELGEFYKQAFFELRQRPDHSEPLYPGAAEALAYLKDGGWILGVATGKSRRGLDAVLVRHHLESWFTTLQTADDGPGKPDPFMLEQAMLEAGASPAETVMIGDTTFDMLMARGAGTDAIGVSWGYHESEELQEAGARVVLASFAELPLILNP